MLHSHSWWICWCVRSSHSWSTFHCVCHHGRSLCASLRSHTSERCRGRDGRKGEENGEGEEKRRKEEGEEKRGGGGREEWMVKREEKEGNYCSDLGNYWPAIVGRWLTLDNNTFLTLQSSCMWLRLHVHHSKPWHATDPHVTPTRQQMCNAHQTPTW